MLIPVSDPTALDSHTLQLAVELWHFNVVELLIPVSDYHIVLQYLHKDGLDTLKFQCCIDKYEALQKKERLQQNIGRIQKNPKNVKYDTIKVLHNITAE